MNSPNFSRHIFIFPFQWDYIGRKVSQKGHIPYDERTDIRMFDQIFSQESPLQRKFFEIGSSAKYYNEYVYFYPFVRKALYGTKDNESVYFYELEDVDGHYKIDIKVEDSTKLYDLVLETVSVHVFDTGVGVVTYSLLNKKYTDQEDILRINDYGRRLYPQYMTDDRLAAKSSFLANSISGNIGTMHFYDDFSQYEAAIEGANVFLPPDHIRQVFGYTPNGRVGDESFKFVFRDEDERAGTIRISPVMDDRMYFLSFYYNDPLSKKMKARKPPLTSIVEPSISGYAYELDEESDFWYRYLFGDGNGKGLANGELQLSEIERCSYARWVENGTLIGITRDSSVYLTNWDLIETHFSSMYYQMAILCLVQRACVLRFRSEVANLTESILVRRRRTGKGIKGLYENYIRFLNRIYFREVTSQIQGIEMYEMFQKNMNIEREVRALDEEMSELFNYLDIDEQGKLNKIANIYLPLALLTGFLGINTFADDGWFKSLFARTCTGSSLPWGCTIGDWMTFIVLFLCLFFPVRYYIMYYFKKKKR